MQKTMNVGQLFLCYIKALVLRKALRIQSGNLIKHGILKTLRGTSGSACDPTDRLTGMFMWVEPSLRVGLIVTESKFTGIPNVYPTLVKSELTHE